MNRNEPQTMQNLYHDLQRLLQQEPAFTSDGRILKNVVTERALALDPRLLGLLLESDTIRAHFFTSVAGTLVFDKVKFQEFLSNKTFLPDSYTAFTNRIGLMVGNDYLWKSNEVVLAWPYKDTILEGGMTKEDSGRAETFWNTTLAPDDISRLFEPKAMTSWARWNADAVKTNAPVPVDRVSGTDSLMLKGNNLLALHSLRHRYAERVQLIYIDPPYNTGSDEFQYNDTFNHSSWLTFLKNRVHVARTLLRPDGSLFMSIDSNELGYAIVLLDEIFGRENMVVCAAVKRGSVTGHKAINAGVVNVVEFVLGYAKNRSQWKPNRLYRARGRSDRYSTFIRNRRSEPDDWEFCSLLDAFAASIGVEKRQLREHFGGDYEAPLYEFVKRNAESVIRTAEPDADKVSKEVRAAIARSRSVPQRILVVQRQEEPDIYLRNGQRILFYSDRLVEIDGEIVTAEALSDLWDDTLPNDLHNEGGVSLKKGKKPERLMKRILELASAPGDLTMDFFSGSGSFAAVAHKTGRQWIAVEQLEYTGTLPLQRLKNVVAGDQSGVSRGVQWTGGGDFVYAELAQWNSRLVERILSARGLPDLETLRKDVITHGFLRYRTRVDALDRDQFASLGITDQKRLLLECLDMNHLYVNRAEIDDPVYEVSDLDKELTRSFYSSRR